MSKAVHILGGSQTDFATRYGRDSHDPLREMLDHAVHGALADTGVAAAEVETVHVGNFAAETFTGQAHLGAMVPMIEPAWSSLPISRHEGACASGSLALLAATADIEAGRYDVALVVGVEVMRNVPGPQAAQHLGCAAWAGHETREDELPWPSLFDRIAAEVDKRHGLDREHLSQIAQWNRENARRNPLAQTRGWTTEDAQFSRGNSEANPVVVGQTLASDCGRITDGAAAVVLVSDRYWQSMDRGRRAMSSRIGGWGHRVAALPLGPKLDASEGADYLFPNVRDAVTDAYRRAGLDSARDLDVVELHDCFTITEYVLLEHLGIAAPGRAGAVIDDGVIAFDGPLPVNPSGGLIGAGHPVGATGVRMLLDVHRQVTGQAGEYQVAGATTAATLNIGGSCSTAASFVVHGAAA